MHTTSLTATKLASVAFLFVALLSSAGAADPGSDSGEQRAKHRQEWVRAKLERDANRLEIKASQQAAWQAYATARSALAERAFSRPARDADAATIAKARADRAADGARKLAVLAETTTKLQAVLSPEQRKTLDQITHASHHLGHHAGHHHRHGGRQWRHGQEGLQDDGQKNAIDRGQDQYAPSA